MIINCLILEKINLPNFNKKINKNIKIVDLSGQSKDEYLKIIHKFDVIFIKSRTIINKEFISKANNLKVIARMGVGKENIDMQSCDKRKIKVFTIPGGNSEAASEFTICMILNMTRKIFTANENISKNLYNRDLVTGIGLNSLNIGIVGYGNVGKKVARKLYALGVNKIYIYDKKKPKVLNKNFIFLKSLDKLISYSNVVSIHLTLNEDTNNLFNLKNLKLFQRNSILINTSRGLIVNDKDVIKTIKINNLSYVSDVLKNEPNYETNKKQLIKNILLNKKNIIITPHMAAMTYDTQNNLSLKMFEKIFKYFAIK
jgi:D-3-phosphoglycerate dehydrogenase